jgi:hypothetical protein
MLELCVAGCTSERGDARIQRLYILEKEEEHERR